MSERTQGQCAKTRAAAPSLSVPIAAYLLAAIASGCAATSPRPPSPESAQAPPGYVMSGYGTIVRDGYGRCVKSGSWKPENAIRECEPEMFARADAERAKAEAARKAAAEAEAAQRAQAEADRRAREEQAEAARRARAEAERRAREAAAAAAREREPVWRTVGGDAFFPVNKAELNERSKRMLDKLAGRARSANQAKITIVGHADSTGSSKSNLQLSQRRADAVRAYLEAQGVPARAMAVSARGENDPVLDCRNRAKAARGECLQVNRRSEIVLRVLEPRGASAGAR